MTAGKLEQAVQARIRGRLPHVASYVLKREYGKAQRLLEASLRDLDDARRHKQEGT